MVAVEVVSHAEAELSSSNAAGRSALLLRFGREAAELTADASPPPYSAFADDDLLVLVQSGDREALGVLFDRYARLVLSVGLRIIRDTAEAEDLVHDVFLFLLDKSNLFNPAKGPARGWLAKVTYHRALDRKKYLLRRSLYNSTGQDAYIETATSNGADSPEFSYWQSYLQRAFGDLTQDQRTTLELHFFQGFTINEISKKLGKSPVNVRHYYYRGLERLRCLMVHGESAKD